MATQALILAVPSKGRLQEQVAGYLADAGLTLKSVERDYRATIAGQPGIEVKLMSSGEIVAGLGSGEVHLGITGEDLIREEVRDSNTTIALLQPLGLGFADVVVAVPRAWIDVSTMADLDDVCTAFHVRHHRRLRVATKYLELTRAFFAAHGIADYRIVESLGATEGAPAAGLAEAIVDITTTGATLAANDLKVLEDGTILKSQAQLAASLKANWSKSAIAAAERLTARIAARELAKGVYVLRFPLQRANRKLVEVLTQEIGGVALPAHKHAADQTMLCPRERLSDAIEMLRGNGMEASVVAEHTDYVFGEANAVMERLRGALKRKS